jgi:DNA repair protein RadA/Sms
MSKKKSKFVCQECGYETPKWMGRCPGCGSWNSMVEEQESKGGWQSAPVRVRKSQTAVPITKVEGFNQPRFETGIREYNRVLGGGLVPGSLILVGGDPGIGKSTLLLQSSHALASQGRKVLYVSGEESTEQIRLRADRLGSLHEELSVLSETDLTVIEDVLNGDPPDLLVIDSIQTMYHPDITSAPGSVAQVRECTGLLMRFAKERGIAVVIVGHVTKSGAIAGPRMLEHMVDTVLYFEGERHHSFRILRAVKNRFGSTNEMGVFEMKEHGLAEVDNPSEIFLEGRPVGVSGTAVTASLEGSRPILVELQALVATTNFPSPKRMATGIDHNRVTMMIAVLEKRLGFVLQNQDAYLNVVGGLRLNEPAIDLAVVMALASSFRDVPLGKHDLYLGEVGLTGEVRAVSRIEQRVREAQKMGFHRVFYPAKNSRGWNPPKGMKLIGVSSVQEVLAVALGG